MSYDADMGGYGDHNGPCCAYCGARLGMRYGAGARECWRCENGGAVDGVAVQEVRAETERSAVHDVQYTASQGAQERESDMKRGDAFPGKHLKAEDVDSSFRAAVTVDHVAQEVLGSGKDAESKAVCYFVGKEKALVLNQTNWNMLEMITGQDDSDNWRGAKAVLYRTTTQYQGKTVPALRLDPLPLGQPTARTVQSAPVMRPAPLPATLPPPETDDYQVDDSDVPFSAFVPFLAGLVGFGSLIG